MKRRSTVSDLFWDGPLTSYHEGLILGNGDLGAVMYGNQWELKFILGKNDVFESFIVELIGSAFRSPRGLVAFKVLTSNAFTAGRKHTGEETRGREVIDGAYDKMIVRGAGIDMPLRLLSPYQGFDSETFDACVGAVKERYPEWLA